MICGGQTAAEQSELETQLHHEMGGGATHDDDDDYTMPTTPVLSVMISGEAAANHREYHSVGRTSMICGGQTAAEQRGLDLGGVAMRSMRSCISLAILLLFSRSTQEHRTLILEAMVSQCLTKPSGGGRKKGAIEDWPTPRPTGPPWPTKEKRR